MKTFAAIFLSFGLLWAGAVPACLGAASAGQRAALVSAEAPLAPPFTLTDVDGHRRALADFRGRPVALYFFCGCSWCRQCAQVWGQFQRSGSLGPRPGAAAPATVVVFSGGAVEARAFAAQAGLDLRQTALLLDPALRVTQDLYHAEPCPRVVVLDAQGRMRYTNTHRDDAPRTAPALAVASRALTALRACEATPESQATPAKSAALPGATPGNNVFRRREPWNDIDIQKRSFSDSPGTGRHLRRRAAGRCGTRDL